MREELRDEIAVIDDQKLTVLGFGAFPCLPPADDLVADSIDLPDNAVFPWNDMIDMSDQSTRGIGMSLGAIHDQMIVVADLLRIMIQQGDRIGQLERRVNRMAQAVGE